jgi:hypothetical protein
MIGLDSLSSYDQAKSKALFALWDICNKSQDGLLNLVGTMLLIPVEYAFR